MSSDIPPSLFSPDPSLEAIHACTFAGRCYPDCPLDRASLSPPTGGRDMTWVLMATGFTGALTMIFLARQGLRKLGLHPSIEVYFSPRGGCLDAVVRELRSARREVLVQAYSFTADPITFGLVEA